MYGLWDVPRNRIAVKMFIMIMFAYSAMKNRSEGVQYATGEEWRTTNSVKKNEVAGPKWKQHSVVDLSGDESIA